MNGVCARQVSLSSPCTIATLYCDIAQSTVSNVKPASLSLKRALRARELAEHLVRWVGSGPNGLGCAGSRNMCRPQVPRCGPVARNDSRRRERISAIDRTRGQSSERTAAQCHAVPCRTVPWARGIDEMVIGEQRSPVTDDGSLCRWLSTSAQELENSGASAHHVG